MKMPKVAQLASVLSFLTLVGSIGFMLYVWRSAVHQVEHLAMDASDDAHVAASRTAWDRTQALLRHMNGSSSSLAEVLSNNSFSQSDYQVSRALFLTYKAFYPIVTQVSFAREDGFLFSYLALANGATSALFSNASSFSPSGSFAPCCYFSQSVDRDSGYQSGAPSSASLLPSTTSWLNGAFSRTFTYISLGSKLNEAEDHLILITAPMKVVAMEKTLSAVLSLGISVQGLLDMIDSAGNHGGSLFLVSEDGQMLQNKGMIPDCRFSLDNETLSIRIGSSNASHFSKEYAVSCKDDGFDDVSALDIGGQAFQFYCSSLHLGNDVVLVQAFPYISSMNRAHKLGTIAYFLLISVLLMAVVTFALIFLRIVKYQRRDAFLRSSLIKQKEATQQAERKSMNKSLAFASASHDVRTSLAGITGLIELCQAEVKPQSELEKNLDQMGVCASKLLGIVNSVLDMSKVEAGKMQLEEGEFDISKLIEESADIFHIIALKKGLEVLWDPCDSSVLNSPRVKGDSGRLKEILDNLLSNAVKFTSEGHVLVRAWARRLNLDAFADENAYNCNFSRVPRLCSCFSVQKADVFDDAASVYSPGIDPNTIEFVFEVDDTGAGIPRDKWESIFENFVQVKEANNGHQGTGLGLGIVQSYVRLMGGEISIIDKGLGEKGTCFRFNIFLKSSEAADRGTDFLSLEDQVQANLPISTSSELKRKNQKAAQANAHAILLVHGKETRRILGRWLEGLGVRILAVDQWELLIATVERIVRQKPSVSHLCIFDRSSSFAALPEAESSLSAGENTTSEVQELVAAPVHDQHKKTTSFSASMHIMIIIDMGLEFCGRNPCFAVNDLLKGINYNQCKVVWLANSNTPAAEIGMAKNKEVPCDLLLHKPVHGSRLQAIVDLLQGFDQPKEIISEQNKRDDPDVLIQSDKHKSDMPLSGLRVLLAEDNAVLRRLTLATLTRLGGTVETCENGREAVEMVRRTVQEGMLQEDGRAERQGQWTRSLLRSPFDMIFMDCEMPIMDGYQATREIREEEKQYGFHTPIIALTAHALGEHGVDFVQAGMDFHLMKPLQPAMLMDVVNRINKI